MHLDLPFLLALAGTASSALVQTAQVLPSDTALLAAPNALIQPNVYSPLATSSARGVPHLRSRRKQQRVLCDHNAPKHGTKDEKHRVTPVDLKDNFDWVYNWTSLGDSYTAAPGAGKRISDDEDDKCLQFHGSYASILNQICSSREGDGRKWNFIACSGDTTKEIRQQVAWLSKQSQDLVTLTAGGNDAFLSDILGACIYAVLDNKLCEKSQKRSKDVIDSILKTNITTVLNELHPKMAEGGIVVYSLYSRFFNETTTHCSSKSMNLMSDSSLGTWTRKLREELNQLVLDANKQIKLAIEEVRDKKKMRIEIVEPDEYIGAIHGRMCEDGQSDDYNNAKNGNMAFTMLDFNSHTPTKKVRSIEDEKESLRYHSLSLLPKRNVVESLKARGLGDFWTGLTDGSKVKDWVKKKLTTLELMSSFHLNLVGNTIVAGLVLQAIENARRKLAEEERDRKCMWPPVTDARCMRRELGAPQRKDDGEPDVTTAVKAFCKKYKGHRPNNGTGTFSLNPHLPLLKIHGTALTGLVDGYSSGYPVRERTSYWYYSFWIASDYNPPRKPQFSKSFFRTCEPDPIEEDLCVHLLLGGMNFCDPNSGLTHGTEIEDGCSKFDGDQSLEKHDFTDARDTWCKDPTKDLSDSGGYSGLSFTYKANNDSQSCDPKQDLKVDCHDSVNNLWKRCATKPGDKKKHDINAKDGPLRGSGTTEGKCGTYTYSYKAKPSNPPGANAVNGNDEPIKPVCGSRARDVPVDDVFIGSDKAFEKACLKADGKTISEIEFPKELNHKGSHTAYYIRADEAPKNAYKDHSTCNDFDGKIDKKDCYEGFAMAWNTCNPDINYGDEGGKDAAFVYRCVQYSVQAKRGAPS